MESPEFICTQTILEHAKRSGLSTALLTSKNKLLGLLQTGADYALSAEVPDQAMINAVGPTEDIYSPDINLWLFKALRIVLKERDPDVVYCSTTDGMMHKYAPEDERSVRHIEGLDKLLGQIIDDEPSREVYLTADHGMSKKSHGIDIEKLLDKQGIRARAIPIIKDRYVAHHQNLGGASYVYLANSNLAEEAMAVLGEANGIEEVYVRKDAAEKFLLMDNRIGDLLALGDKETVFGPFAESECAVQVRSHGSRYESQVPILAHNKQGGRQFRRNFEIGMRL